MLYNTFLPLVYNVHCACDLIAYLATKLSFSLACDMCDNNSENGKVFYCAEIKSFALALGFQVLKLFVFAKYDPTLTKGCIYEGIQSVFLVVNLFKCIVQNQDRTR